MSLFLSMIGGVLFLLGVGTCLLGTLLYRRLVVARERRTIPAGSTSTESTGARLHFSVDSPAVDDQFPLSQMPPTELPMLSSRDERFFTLVENLTDGLRIVENGITTYVNQRFCDITGYSADELVGNVDHMVFDENQLKIVASQQKLRREGKKTSYEVSLKRKSGDLVPTIVSAHPIFAENGEWIGSCGVFTDITARQNSEIELRESEQRFRDFAESASDRFWEMDENLRFTFISSREPDRLMYNRSFILGKTRWEKAGADPDQNPNWFNHRDDMQSQRPFRNFRYTDVDDDGVEHHWSVSGKPVCDRNGKFCGYRGTAKDLTAEVAAHRRASLAQTQLLNAFDTISEGFAIFDPNDKLILCNRRCTEIFPELTDVLIPGISFEDMFRTAITRGIFECKVAELEMRVAERMAKRAVPAMRFIQQLRGNRWVQITERRTADGGIVQVWTDITELKRGEQQLLQAQKMEAVGQLTGGIAHDFNNLLAVILGSLELIQDRGGAIAPNVEKLIGRSISAAKRGAALTQRLLSFSRKQPLQPKPTDIKLLIENLHELFRTSLGESIEIITEFDAGIPPALVDPNQLETVLLNLALNSRDAMPQGGQLRIVVSPRFVEQFATEDDFIPQVAMRCVPGRYICISVSDTGTGMTPQVQERIFEPFFTTKDIGKGSGLGMSMVYGYVAQSGGRILIESTLGLGTTIELLLPEAIGAEAVQEIAGSDALRQTTYGEYILIVEDDDSVRELLVSILENLGYSLLHAPDSETALRELSANPNLDLLLSDVVLPGGMNGVLLAEEARRRIPGLKILLMSGYMEDSINAQLGDGMPLLRKPFRTAELAEKIREILDVPRASGTPLLRAVQVVAGESPLLATGLDLQAESEPRFISNKK